MSLSNGYGSAFTVPAVETAGDSSNVVVTAASKATAGRQGGHHHHHRRVASRDSTRGALLSVPSLSHVPEPPPSPVVRRSSNGSTGSGNNNNSSSRPPLAANRARANSNGSTMGAFDPIPQPSPATGPSSSSSKLTGSSGDNNNKKKKQSQQQRKKKKSPENSQAQLQFIPAVANNNKGGSEKLDMSNIASLAAMMDDDDDDGAHLIITKNPIHHNQKVHQQLKNVQKQKQQPQQRMPHFQSRTNNNPHLLLDGSNIQNITGGFDDLQYSKSDQSGITRSNKNYISSSMSIPSYNGSSSLEKLPPSSSATTAQSSELVQQQQQPKKTPQQSRREWFRQQKQQQQQNDNKSGNHRRSTTMGATTTYGSTSMTTTTTTTSTTTSSIMSSSTAAAVDSSNTMADNNRHRRHHSSVEEQREQMNLFSSIAQGSALIDESINPTTIITAPIRPNTSAALPPPPPPSSSSMARQVTIDGDFASPKEKRKKLPPVPQQVSTDTVFAAYQALEKADDDSKNDDGDGSSYQYSDDDTNDKEHVQQQQNSRHKKCSSFSDLLEYEIVRHFLYNKDNPEFTSLQQFIWALLIGIFMGVYTALWKFLIQFVVDFMWETVPEYLYEELGIFTDANGSFPLTHWMWICPTIGAGILSYIFAILKTPIPGQDQWIASLHKKGIQDSETFLTLFVLSTAGMSTGLSLGPELPLVLTGGMFGSHIGMKTRQSVLSARALNITAASAAVSGFFGFPMAGALFVLEIPHRMGLQYFEALSPATIASIVAVIVNRLIVRNDVTGYFKYPFLTNTLPSSIFYIAVAYGIFGSFLGVFYVKVVKKLKGGVHDLFHWHPPHHDDQHNDDHKESKLQQQEKLALPSGNEESSNGTGSTMNEYSPLVKTESNTLSHQEEEKESTNSNKVSRCLSTIGTITRKILSFGIKDEPTRACVAGSLAGLCVGVIGMFVPHVMFWGEEQIQNLIDKGRTPLPVFGQGNETTSDLTQYGLCMIDPNDSEAIAEGFSIGCAALISLSKVIVTGLSLGTGIIGGHFWGPLFVGCAGSHLFTDLMVLMTKWTPGNFFSDLAAYPCVAILCIMGSTHIVTFRAHMAITLILTLTISAFSDEKGMFSAGDYSAVFPLLVISCFVSLMFTRDHIFYKEQRCRGDIMASPEVLCEPGKEGQVGFDDYEHEGDDDDDDLYPSDDNYTSSEEPDVTETTSRSIITRPIPVHENAALTQDEIENAFEMVNNKESVVRPILTKNASEGSSSCTSELEDRIAELLAKPLDSSNAPKKNNHRKYASSPVVKINPGDMAPAPVPANITPQNHRRTSSFAGMKKPTHRRTDSDASAQSVRSRGRIDSFGEISDFHPNLFDQARQQAATRSQTPRTASSGRHSRSSSSSSIPVLHNTSNPLLADLNIER